MAGAVTLTSVNGPRSVRQSHAGASGVGAPPFAGGQIGVCRVLSLWVDAVREGCTGSVLCWRWFLVPPVRDVSVVGAYERERESAC